MYVCCSEIVDSNSDINKVAKMTNDWSVYEHSSSSKKATVPPPALEHKIKRKKPHPQEKPFTTTWLVAKSYSSGQATLVSQVSIATTAQTCYKQQAYTSTSQARLTSMVTYRYCTPHRDSLAGYPFTRYSQTCFKCTASQLTELWNFHVLYRRIAVSPLAHIYSGERNQIKWNARLDKETIVPTVHQEQQSMTQKERDQQSTCHSCPPTPNPPSTEHQMRMARAGKLLRHDFTLYQMWPIKKAWHCGCIKMHM